MIIEKISGDSIGRLDIYPNDPEETRGFWLGVPWHGKGYMSEAVKVTTDYAFDVLGMKEMIFGNAKPISET